MTNVKYQYKAERSRALTSNHLYVNTKMQALET